MERRFGAPPQLKSEEKRESQAAFAQKRTETKEERKLRNRIARLEEEISALEEQLSGIETELSGTTDHARVMELSGDYLRVKDQLDARTAEWERKMEELG